MREIKFRIWDGEIMRTDLNSPSITFTKGKMNQPEYIDFEKKETQEKFKDLFERYANTRNWEITFNYDWCVNHISSIDKEDNGWYDKLIEEENK